MSYRALGVQTSRAQTPPASLGLNEAKPAGAGKGMEGACLRLKYYRGKMVARLRLTSSFKPREGVYRGLQTPQKRGVRHGQDFAGRP